MSGNSNEQQTVSVNVSSATGQLVADFAMMIQTDIEAAAGQTVRIFMNDDNVMGFVALGMSERPGAASVTMQWEVNPEADTPTTFGDNAIIAVPLTLAT